MESLRIYVYSESQRSVHSEVEEERVEEKMLKWSEGEGKSGRRKT